MNKYKKLERHKLYISHLNNELSVTIKSFLNYGKSFGIPEITVRRDIKELVHLNYIVIEMGLIKLANNNEYEITREEKILKNKDQKAHVGRVASELINNSQIFVGTGTTCEAFVKSITKPIDVLYTNGFEVARIAKSNQNIKEIILIGGKIRIQSGALCGSITTKILSEMRFAQSFITFTNMDEESFDFFNNHLDEAYVVNKIIEVSSDVIAMIDNSKINNTKHGSRINNISAVNTLVLSSELEDKILKRLNNIVKVKW